MQTLINRIHSNASFNRKTGWLGTDSMVQIRSLLKKQATLLLEKYNYDTNSVLFKRKK